MGYVSLNKHEARQDITDETFLTRHETDAARARLVSLGVLEEQKREVMYYRVLVEKILELGGDELGLPESGKPRGLPKSSKPGLPETGKPDEDGLPKTGKPAIAEKWQTGLSDSGRRIAGKRQTPHTPYKEEEKKESTGRETARTLPLSLVPLPPVEEPVRHDLIIEQACAAYRKTGRAAVCSNLVSEAWLRAIRALTHHGGSEADAAKYLLERIEMYASYAARWPEREKRFIPKFLTFLEEHTYAESEDRWKELLPKSRGAALPDHVEGEGPAAWESVLQYVNRHGAAGRPIPGRVTRRDANNKPLEWASDIAAPKLDPRVEFSLSKMAGSRRKGLDLVENTPPERLHFVRAQFLTAYAQTGDLRT